MRLYHTQLLVLTALHPQVRSAEEFSSTLHQYRQHVAFVICPFGLSDKLQKDVQRELEEEKAKATVGKSECVNV